MYLGEGLSNRAAYLSGQVAPSFQGFKSISILSRKVTVPITSSIRSFWFAADTSISLLPISDALIRRNFPVLSDVNERVIANALIEYSICRLAGRYPRHNWQKTGFSAISDLRWHADGC